MDTYQVLHLMLDTAGVLIALLSFIFTFARR